LNISFKHVKSAAGCNASHFERKDSDLLYRHSLTLNDALQCRPIKLTTMDGRTILVALDQIPSPGSVKQLAGEGMRFNDDTCVGTKPNSMRCGDLYIVFDVQFPKKLGGPDKR